MIRSTQVLWLVRHGESTWNTLGLAQGHCDQARLTRLGQRQARAVASQLRSRPVGGFADELAVRCREMEAERAGEVAVVAHGGTLRMLNAFLRGIPVERMRWEPLSNGCILRSPEGWPAVWPAPQHESR